MAIEKLPVTVLVAVKNEAANISKCLASLIPAREIIVIDSQSKDGTVQKARRMGAKVVQFFYKGGYPKKRQWALESLKIKTPWVFLLDADEEPPAELWGEIKRNIEDASAPDAFLIKKQFHFLGKKFTFGGFSFEAVLFFRKGKAQFENLIKDPTDMDMEVHERLIVDGSVGRLKTPLIHNDFKNLESYLDRHNKYSSWEAKLRKTFLETGCYGKSSIKARLFGNAQERRRFLKKIVLRIPFEPFVWFFYHYFLRLGFLEGWRGFAACRIRAQYIFQVRAKIKEMELKER